MATSRDVESLQRRLYRLEHIVLTMLAFEGARTPSDFTAAQHLLRNYYAPGMWPDPFGDETALRDFIEKLALRHRMELVGTPLDEAGSFQRLQTEVHSYFALLTLGVDLGSAPMTRFIPLRVYLDTSDANSIDAVSSAINRVIDDAGFAVSDEFPEVRGSWLKKWFGRSKDVLSQPEVHERLAKVERAVEMQALHAPQAVADRNQAESVAALITSLKDTPTAAIQLGSIVILKTQDQDGNDCIQARTLTQQQLIALEKDQALLRTPNEFLEQMAKGEERKQKAKAPAQSRLNQPAPKRQQRK